MFDLLMCIIFIKSYINCILIGYYLHNYTCMFVITALVRMQLWVLEVNIDAG